MPKLAPATRETIARFLRAHAGPPASSGVVVGLSGGIDSALAARLARDALGAERVLGVLLPGAGADSDLIAETEAYAEAIGVAHRTIRLEEIEESFHHVLPEISDRVTRGNTTARVRMTVLYAVAREAGRLVLGTGNKSELLLGYFTKGGDGGVDLLPLGDLYKTQLRELATELDLPVAVRERKPTAGFWKDQTDEGELGLPYAELDRILFGLEQLLTAEEIRERTGVPLEQVLSVVDRVGRNRHKRRLPPIPKLGLRTVGLDWRD